MIRLIQTSNLCSYGCGEIAKFVLYKKNKFCCQNSFRKCIGYRSKNSEGLKKAYLNNKRIPGFAFRDKQNWSKNKLAFFDKRIRSKYSHENVFVENSSISTTVIKKILFQLGLKNKCNICNISFWKGKELKLELDHINGNNKDNRRNNLRLLCPNCHSQTPNYKGKNRKSKKYLDKDLIIKTLKNNNFNIRRTLLSLNLAAKGGNYRRIKNILSQIWPSSPTAETNDFKIESLYRNIYEKRCKFGEGFTANTEPNLRGGVETIISYPDRIKV